MIVSSLVVLAGRDQDSVRNMLEGLTDRLLSDAVWALGAIRGLIRFFVLEFLPHPRQARLRVSRKLMGRLTCFIIE